MVTQMIGRVSEGMECRLARVAAGLSLFQIGALTGIEPARISEFERGVRHLNGAQLGRLRRALEDELARKGLGCEEQAVAR